jgi:hypothetical protein
MKNKGDNMGDILNMEYRLYAIKYLFELQIKEKKEAEFIHINDEAAPCDGVAYRRAIMQYLVENNGVIIQQIIQKHIVICNTIIDLWNKYLMNLPPINIELLRKEPNADLRYRIFCILSQNMDYPFKDLLLIRKNGDTYECGNYFLEDNRYWMEYQPHSRRYEVLKKITTPLDRYIPNFEYIETKKYMPSTMAEFVDGVWRFLCEWQAAQAEQQNNQPQQAYLGRPSLSLVVVQAEQQINQPQQVQQKQQAEQQDLDLPSGFLNELQEKGFIEDATARPLKWMKTNPQGNMNKSMIAFLVYGICEKADKDCINKYKNKYNNNPFRRGERCRIGAFETLFGITNLGKLISNNKKENGIKKTSADCKALDVIIKKHSFIS